MIKRDANIELKTTKFILINDEWSDSGQSNWSSLASEVTRSSDNEHSHYLTKTYRALGVCQSPNDGKFKQRSAYLWKITIIIVTN